MRWGGISSLPVILALSSKDKTGPNTIIHPLLCPARVGLGKFFSNQIISLPLPNLLQLGEETYRVRKQLCPPKNTFSGPQFCPLGDCLPPTPTPPIICPGVGEELCLNILHTSHSQSLSVHNSCHYHVFFSCFQPCEVRRETEAGRLALQPLLRGIEKKIERERDPSEAP